MKNTCNMPYIIHSGSYQCQNLPIDLTVELYFKTGAVKVKCPGRNKELWLVVVKYRQGGYRWYLLSKVDCINEHNAVRTALEGYPLCWEIEEIHRQIKQNYNLEAIRLQRYEALKSMNALLWIAVSFLYTRESLALEIIFEPELGLVNRKRFSDLLRFVYYKLAFAVKKILALAKVYFPPMCLNPNNGQLVIPFEEWG